MFDRKMTWTAYLYAELCTKTHNLEFNLTKLLPQIISILLREEGDKSN